MFYLVRLDRDADGNLVETPLPDFGTFDKGADAAKASKAAAVTLGGAKVQCRRIAQAGDWRAAIAKRFESGELTPLPAKWDVEPIKDHFAHLWLNDASKIAYIENEEHGILFKVTALTPGRYISRFYPDVDDDKRRHLIAAIDPSGEVFYAWTPDEIAEVYKHGPESCMDGDHDFDDLPCWPTAPYGAGDLAVAYTKNKHGNIQSRAVCWPAKKLYGRIYGDAQRMKAAMEAEGFQTFRERNDVHGNNKVGSFIGAKLLKIPSELADHEYVMPYFDDIRVAIDMGDHFLTAEKAEEGQTYVASGSSTHGTSTLHRICPKSKCPAPITEFTFVHGVNEEWCATAVYDHTFKCAGSGRRYPHEFKVVMGHGAPWSKDYFEQNGEHCRYTGKNWPKSEMVQLGDRRVHRSVRDRFNEKGEELTVTQRRRKSASEWVTSFDHEHNQYSRYERPRRLNASGDIVAETPPQDRVDATELALGRRRRRAAA
ncbi:hypothetical protein [Bradyrhizobium phage BDU-MI-1]|nr:hypothetical protein [Bradyrhizobium phage BDU-MI-1]